MFTALEVIQVVLLSTVKFFFAHPLAIGFGFNYWQTSLMTSTGGILGVFLFYYLSIPIFRFYGYLVRKIRKALHLKEHPKHSTEGKRSFTKRNKFLVKLRGKYGMVGLIILTPTLLSIPVGSFLLSKYYQGNKWVLFYMCISVICWSMLVSSIYFFKLI